MYRSMMQYVFLVVLFVGECASGFIGCWSSSQLFYASDIQTGRRLQKYYHAATQVSNERLL